MPPVKQVKSGYIFGCRGMVVTALLATGANNPAAVAHAIKTAQKAETDITFIAGEESSLRGGDTIIAVISERDKISGATVKFTNARFDADATVVVAGGKLIQDVTVPDDPVTTGWDAPMIGDSDPAPFKAELYAANYTAGGVIDGFWRITYPYCTGRLGTLVYGDKEWSTPSFEIKSTENPILNIPCVRKEWVAALPAELT